jgi:prolyl oligopeptidase
MKEESDFVWLEEVRGERALAWVRDMNACSLPRLEGDERFEDIRAAAEKIYTAKDRIAYSRYFGGVVHNFWQDDQQVRGIWRRTSLQSYASETPQWETVLDIDALATAENENWVYKGYHCLAPDYRHCIVSLSRGGGDAVVSREFDTVAKRFVEGGFELPEAKTNLGWIDNDTLLVATDFGPGSLTTSGYPRLIRQWTRGTDIATSKVLLEGQKTDMAVAPVIIDRPEGSHIFLSLVPNFFMAEYWYLGIGGRIAEEKKKVPLPVDADFQGIFEGRLLALLRTDWKIEGGPTLRAGSLVAIDMAKSLNAGKPVDAKTILAPTDRIALKQVIIGKDSVLVSIMEDVNGVLVKMRPGQGGDWIRNTIELPEKGSIDVVTADSDSSVAMVNFESFLTPASLYLIEQNQAPRVIKSLPERFDATGFKTEQLFATSRDGTRIPYFVVRPRTLPMDGSTPTLLGGYGGFENSLTPTYMAALGAGWLKENGIFVIANIRGGGEYGPSWHQAALLENRQRAFDDFIAVAEDLVRQGYTRPAHLGIRGGSNGGLLVAAVTMQRPELFSAVLCAVPLLDMIRYNKLFAGASWMAEYGNPDVPKQRAYIEKYSPYQNVRPDTDYPEIFFWTNTLDDRVHPGHARRMVAKMASQDHPVLYFENTEGGHGGGANLRQEARTTALELIYLLQKLKQ